MYLLLFTHQQRQAWDDVPLTLETATPTFGINIPALSPWNLSVYKPVVMRAMSKSRGIGLSRRSRTPAMEVMTSAHSEADDDDRAFGLFGGDDWHPGMAVSSKGSISATFRVPGLISIPSDEIGRAHV